MTDRERARLRGPVRSVRSDHAELDARTNDWGPFRQGQTLVYDVEGRLDGFVWDDGVTTRDERGLRTTVNRSGPLIDRPPGLEWGMGVDPTRLADVLTRYDAADRPVEIVYRTADQRVLHRIQILYVETSAGPPRSHTASAEPAPQAAASPPINHSSGGTRPTGSGGTRPTGSGFASDQP